MKFEAIVLSGGEGWRLKPDEWTPKPLLNVSATETLLDIQVRWLMQNEFTNIVLASSRSFLESEVLSDSKVQMCIERKKLGTGGAVKRASALVDSDKFYVMNVDDIVFYDPRTLYDKATEGAAILLAKPQLPFASVAIENEDTVKRFEHRPVIDMWVNAGHYVFSKDIVTNYFPEEGDLEHIAMQKIAQDNHLHALKYSGDWLTLNTAKDLLRIQEYLRNLKPTARKARRA